MSNLNTVDPNALETVTGGAIIASPSTLNNSALTQTVNTLSDVTRRLAHNQNQGLFGGNSSWLTAVLFSRLLGPRPF